MTALPTGLFKMEPSSAGAAASRFDIQLDPSEAYLNDHRPGGEPLFSTVMAIEAAVCGARIVAATPACASVDKVHVRAPYILHGAGPHHVALNIVRSHERPEHHLFDCRITSGPAGRELIHLEAQVRFGGRAHDPAPLARPLGVAREGPVIQAARIYELFFHGPAYQVVAEAQYRHNEMNCVLTRWLPRTHRDGRLGSEMAPQIIEFALQTAGLLEIAANGRMMIPDSIARVERLNRLDPAGSGIVHSRATYGSKHLQSIDVEVFDEQNQIILLVEEYRTVPLPFAVEVTKLARLHDALVGKSG
jgi:hypothetical protein